MTGTVTHDPPPGPADRPGRPLIVTEDAVLLDDLLRLCAAAGATPEVHHGVPESGDGWAAAPLVLVGDDAVGRVRGAVRRPGVVLVGRDQDDSGVWKRAVEIGADHVLMLPDGEAWLVDRIADVAEGIGRPALTVGVIGGRGGAGGMLTELNLPKMQVTGRGESGEDHGRGAVSIRGCFSNRAAMWPTSSCLRSGVWRRSTTPYSRIGSPTLTARRSRPSPTFSRTFAPVT
ncbi:hypothetical protein GCM10009787_43350 [Streptomyces bangladeshensis]|uniref:Rv3660c-like CheY-like N-terminal domain-containing protein n=1 Tax=Streptomyces bangladeshensis TaxID=295352 RepID=A0ABN3BPL8_9ACTN